MSSRAPSVGEDSIPLYCALCPERQNFSDVSHLLTHISSKSHLSRKFDTELRAQGDDEVSAASLAEYQRWYAKHRIGDLLQRRMETKQRRRQPRRERPVVALRTRTRGDPPSTSSGRSVSVKAEPREDSADVFTTGRYDSPGSRNDTPGFQTPTSGRGDSGLSLNYADIGKFEIEGSEIDTSSFDGTLSLENFELEDDDTVQLKGVTYPGMAGFDAATPEQRRKRNQKKPKSVVQNMRESSESIEALECIWNGVGNFDRSRDIYASPSPEGSPVSRKAELPAKKKKKKQAKNGSPTANRARLGVTTRGAARAQRQAAVRQSTVATAAADQVMEESDNGNDDSSWTAGHGLQEGGDMLRADDHSIPNRMNSPLDHGGYQMRQREALQLMNCNEMIGSHEQAALPKQQHYPYPYFGQSSQARDLGMMGNHQDYGYMQSHHGPGDTNLTNLNPLSLRGAPTPTYPSVMPSATSTYDDSSTITPLNGFQAINPHRGLHGIAQSHLPDANSHMPRN
ncbi:hypothetical protein RB595_007197 [Gaeumannomyces hyphopodioides]